MGKAARQPGALRLLAGTTVGALLLVLGASQTPGSAAVPAPSLHRPTQLHTFGASSVLMSFRPAVPAAEQHRVLRAVGARDLGQVGVGVRHLRVPRGSEQRIVALLRAQPSVRYAEPDYLSRPTGVPTDPGFALQWAQQNTGQTVNGVTGIAGADADVVPAWNVTTGSASIVVAEVDTGVDYTHPDLAANIWTNDGTVNQCPAGTHGFNVLTNACDPMDDDVTYGGHGTHVAGIIGAVGGNGVGVAGVNWTTSLLPVKWIGSSGAGATSDLVRALDWVLAAKAAGVNVRVVNDSNVFIGTAYSQALADEIDLLAQHDILFVTAAGSSAGDNDDPAVRRYPCAYGRSNELCATWSDQSDQLASSATGFGSANYGASSVDLAAPGDNIYSTLRGGGYGYVSGGSMAAAAVSGAAALVLSADPLSTAGLKADLLEHVKPLASLATGVRTGGRLDVCAAITACRTGVAPGPQAPFAVTVPPVTTTQSQPGHPSPEPQQGSVLSAGTGDWDFAPTSFSYQWSACSPTGGSCSAVPGAVQTAYTPTFADVGRTLRVTVSAGNLTGSTSSRSIPTMVVQAAPPTSTVGKTVIAASEDPADADWERLNAVTLGQSGSLAKLTVYLARQTAGSQEMRGVVYVDAAGRPGALIGATSAVTVSSTASSGWVDLPFVSAVSLTAGPYWIGIHAGPSTRVFALRYDESTAGSGAVAPAAFATGPLTLSTSWRLQAEQISLYGSYATAVAPTNVTVPTVSGTARQGKTLSASRGTWTATPTSYAFRWFRCSIGTCSTITGATSTSYRLVTADVGSTLRVGVVATNNVGASPPAYSLPTAVVQPCSTRRC